MHEEKIQRDNRRREVEKRAQIEAGCPDPCNPATAFALCGVLATRTPRSMIVLD